MEAYEIWDRLQSMTPEELREDSKEIWDELDQLDEEEDEEEEVSR
jgi:hypothetical protein